MTQESKTAVEGHVGSPDRFLGGAPAAAPVRSLEEANRVIINVWTSGENKAIPGANVGHISIETPHQYISLWPGLRTNRERVSELQHKWNQYFGLRPSSWKASYLDDAVSEAISEKHGREIGVITDRRDDEEVVALIPEVGIRLLARDEPAPEDAIALLAAVPLQANIRIALYDLKIDRIHAEFAALKAHCPGWRLVGSNYLSRLTSDSPESCASVAYRILCAGGMYKGVDKVKASSETASVTKPDILVRHVMKAKAKELAEHHETRGWTFASESNLLTLQRAYGDAPPIGEVVADHQKSPDGCFVM